jgi:hypothetical protein
LYNNKWSRKNYNIIFCEIGKNAIWRVKLKVFPWLMVL